MRKGNRTPEGHEIFEGSEVHMGKKEGLGLGVAPSAITDHVARNNHTIDWEGVRFPSRDNDTTKRGIWEAITIKKTEAQAMNHDGGATDFHSATPSCCLVTPEGSTDDYSSP